MKIYLDMWIPPSYDSLTNTFYIEDVKGRRYTVLNSNSTEGWYEICTKGFVETGKWKYVSDLVRVLIPTKN